MEPRKPGFSDARRAAKDAAALALTRGEGQSGAARAAVAATDAFFQSIREPLKLEPLLAGIACHAGCSWCCHQIVGITLAELSLLAEAVAALPQTRRDAVAARARAAIARGRGLDQAGWWKAQIRCPLLEDDGRCGLHAARPLPCRGYNSADADLCRRSYHGEAVRAPVLGAQHGVYGHAQQGLAEALAENGIAPGLLSLAEGVEKLFS